MADNVEDWRCPMAADGRKIDKELEGFVRGLGAELYGVASAERYIEEFPGKPSPRAFMEDAHSIIVIGLPYEPATVATVLNPDLARLRKKATDDVTAPKVQPAGAERYFLGEENGILVRELQLMGYKTAKYLRHAGCTALHLPPGKQDARFRTAPFYHMPALYLAGMGTLGLNCSILTPEFGPRAYFTSIITDCMLEPGEPMKEDLCTKCMLCKQAVPSVQSTAKAGKAPMPVLPTGAVPHASLYVRWVPPDTLRCPLK